MFITKSESLDNATSEKKYQTSTYDPPANNQKIHYIKMSTSSNKKYSEKEPEHNHLNSNLSNNLTPIYPVDPANQQNVDGQIIKQFVLTSSSQEEREYLVKTIEIATERQQPLNNSISQTQIKQQSNRTPIIREEVNFPVNPQPIISKDIVYKRSQMKLPPLAPICTSRKKEKIMSKKDYDELLKPMQQSGYFNIQSAKSYGVNKANPYMTSTFSTYRPLSNDKKYEKDRTVSLSNLLLRNRPIEEKKSYSCHTHKVKDIEKENTFGIKPYDKEKIVIITRAMRNDKGGVVDLGRLEKEKRMKNFTISTFKNRRQMPMKEKEKRAKIIQKWWRDIAAMKQKGIKNVIKIQSLYRMFYYRNYVYPKLKEQKEVEDKINKITIPFKNKRRKILKGLKDYKPLRLEKKGKDNISSLDWILKMKILLQKQRAFDIIRMKALANKIKSNVQHFNKLYDIIKRRNIFKNGDEFLNKIAQKQRENKLKEIGTHLDNNRLKSRLRKLEHNSYINIREAEKQSRLKMMLILLKSNISKILNERKQEAFDNLSEYENRPKRLLKSRPKLLNRIKKKDNFKALTLALYWKRWLKLCKSLEVNEAAKKLQLKSKKHLSEKRLNKLYHYIIAFHLEFPFDKIRQEANRRTLIRGLRTIRNNQLKKLYESFMLVKDYADFRYMLLNTGASIIQKKFLNAYPQIKQKRKLREKMKNHRVNESMMLQYILQIQQWFKKRKQYKQGVVLYKIRELLLAYFLYRQFKPFLRDFLQCYRLTKGKKSLVLYIFKIFKQKI